MPSHNHGGATGIDTGGQFGVGGGSGQGKGVATTGINNVYTNSVTIAAQGGNAAHNIMQPFITVYFWKRSV